MVVKRCPPGRARYAVEAAAPLFRNGDSAALPGNFLFVTTARAERAAAPRIVPARNAHEPVREYAAGIDGLRGRGDVLAHFVASLPLALAVFDTRMRFVAASRRFLQEYGLDATHGDPAQLSGQSHDDIFPEARLRWRGIHRRVLAGETVTGADETRHGPGVALSRVWEMAPWQSEANGAPCGAILISRLEKRASGRAAPPARHARAPAKPGAAGEALPLMGAMLAHDLSQPLAAAQSALHAASGFLRGGTALPEDVAAAIAHASAQVARAGRIVRHVRDVAAGGGVTPRACAVRQAVSEACEMARGSSTAACDYTIDIPEGLADVAADPEQFQLVLGNLLRNAAQSPCGEAPPRIDITAAEVPGGVEIQVRDRGAGLPEGDAERVFAPFFTTKRDGMGVGLALCRMIVQAHGGRIWASRNPGGGAVFHICLPAAPAKTPRKPGRSPLAC